jgi:hypothetical protein
LAGYHRVTPLVKVESYRTLNGALEIESGGAPADSAGTDTTANTDLAKDLKHLNVDMLYLNVALRLQILWITNSWKRFPRNY